MTALLGYEFRVFASALALSLLDPAQRLLCNAGNGALERAKRPRLRCCEVRGWCAHIQAGGDGGPQHRPEARARARARTKLV